MRTRSRLLLLLVVAGVAATPSAAHAAGTPTWSRAYTEYIAARLAASRARIPAWARKYNMNCSGCHYPAPPRLNAAGIRFKWAGYRMPDEINENVNVERLQNYLSLRGRMRYSLTKTGDQAPSNSSFKFEDATIFYGGPFSRNFGAFFELEREAENSVELVANVSGIWGNQHRFGGFRVGQFHWLQREGVAGFDRPVGINTPTPVGGRLTGSIPFSFNNDQVGIEGFWVSGNNRLSGEILNGINAAGVGDEQDPDRKKDLVLIDQLLFDNAGSGLTAVGYYGSIVGVDSVAPTQTSHFWRLGITANKIVNNFEVLGAVLYGKDLDLPVGAGAFGAAQNTGLGYWVSGQYRFPSAALTVFGRYEFVDPNTDVSSNGNTRYVWGAVLPLGLPEYLRLALEGTIDKPQSGAANKYGLVAQLMLNF